MHSKETPPGLLSVTATVLYGRCEGENSRGIYECRADGVRKSRLNMPSVRKGRLAGDGDWRE